MNQGICHEIYHALQHGTDHGIYRGMNYYEVWYTPSFEWYIPRYMAMVYTMICTILLACMYHGIYLGWHYTGIYHFLGWYTVHHGAALQMWKVIVPARLTMKCPGRAGGRAGGAGGRRRDPQSRSVVRGAAAAACPGLGPARVGLSN
jgi:hypothetical protein